MRFKLYLPHKEVISLALGNHCRALNRLDFIYRPEVRRLSFLLTLVCVDWQRQKITDQAPARICSRIKVAGTTGKYSNLAERAALFWRPQINASPSSLPTTSRTRVSILHHPLVTDRVGKTSINKS